MDKNVEGYGLRVRREIIYYIFFGIWSIVNFNYILGEDRV